MKRSRLCSQEDNLWQRRTKNLQIFRPPISLDQIFRDRTTCLAMTCLTSPTEHAHMKNTHEHEQEKANYVAEHIAVCKSCYICTRISRKYLHKPPLEKCLVPLVEHNCLPYFQLLERLEFHQ